ncbi:MAG: DUF1349 domain-containing protein [Kouleothrix sp.]|nr:DUF1349 domain-containing protein [Kouleothrix sp.]
MPAHQHRPGQRSIALMILCALVMAVSQPGMVGSSSQDARPTPTPEVSPLSTGWSTPPPFEPNAPALPRPSAIRVGRAAPSVDLALPDLDVEYIGRTPRYRWDQSKKWPDPGEMVVFEAHIANRGGSASGPFWCTWTIDGVQQAPAVHTGLAAGAEDILSLSWAWTSGPHTVRLALDSAGAVSEVSELNNIVEDRTNALTLGIWVEQSFYDFYNQNVWQAGWGGNSFDDWMQRHVSIWNGMLARAGVIDRIRLDKVVRAPNGGLQCETNRPADDYEVDLMWGFPSEMVGVPSPAACSWQPRYRDDQSTWDRDLGILHELSHARYLIDLYGFNIDSLELQLASAANSSQTTLTMSNIPDVPELTPPSYLVADGEIVYCNGKSGSSFTGCTRGAQGTRARAHLAGATVYGDQIRIQDGDGSALMGGPGLPVVDGAFHRGADFGYDLMNAGEEYGAHSAGAWNLIAGQRPICGNYNAPCNIGVYLNDLPFNNEIELRYPGGAPVAGATVEVYRAKSYPTWYGKTYEGLPDMVLQTNAQGRASLGAEPFGPDRVIHTFGLSNGVLALKIVTQDKVGVEFLEVTAFNLAYWGGQRDHAIYPITFSHWAARASACYQDLFNQAPLGPGWTWVDPLGDSAYSVGGGTGALRIETFDGNHDITIGNTYAPRLVRSISGDFDVRTRVTANLAYSYQAAGLLVWFDSSNFVWVAHGVNNTIGHHYARGGALYDPPEVHGVVQRTVLLRVVRAGSTITTYYSLDGLKWLQTGSVDYPSAPAAARVGMFVLDNWQNNPLAADFDYFSNGAACSIPSTALMPLIVR